MKKVSFYTLGCKVNQYETQALKEMFANKGYEVVSEDDFAHVYIINSCSVTGISDRKTRQYLRKSKRTNAHAITVLTGCYAETGMEKVKEIEEVDMILGNAEKSKILDNVESLISSQDLCGKKLIEIGGINDTSEYNDFGIVSGMDSRSRAYIKIEDGCDRFCSYCIIPYARGPVRSRPVQSILNEAKLLIEKGYKELILTGINSALYGSDQMDIAESSPQNEQVDLIKLLEKISSLPGDFRIRMSSLEPTVVNARYVKKLIDIDKVCPHLHLSLQSGSDNVLKAMGRRYTRKEYLEIVDVLKSKDPGFSITTDIIVGFPGESESDFEHSVSMVNEVGFSKVHVFKYSKRDGTAAAKMRNQISGTEKNLRSKRLIQTSDSEARSFISLNKGTSRQALVMEYDEERKLYKAVTDNNIEVEVYSKNDLSNMFIDVKL